MFVLFLSWMEDGLGPSVPIDDFVRGCIRPAPHRPAPSVRQVAGFQLSEADNPENVGRKLIVSAKEFEEEVKVDDYANYLCYFHGQCAKKWELNGHADWAHKSAGGSSKEGMQGGSEHAAALLTDEELAAGERREDAELEDFKALHVNRR